MVRIRQKNRQTDIDRHTGRQTDIQKDRQRRRDISLERLTRFKHSSLLVPFVTYEKNKVF